MTSEDLAMMVLLCFKCFHTNLCMNFTNVMLILQFASLLEKGIACTQLQICQIEAKALD